MPQSRECEKCGGETVAYTSEVQSFGATAPTRTDPMRLCVECRAVQPA